MIVSCDREQLEQLTICLDPQSRRCISDNFNLMLLQQQLRQLKPEILDSRILVALSEQLGFLLVHNQSNWRYAN